MEDLLDPTDDFHPRSDAAETRAFILLLKFFEEHKKEVFFSRQLEVIFEDEFFHWITNRAIRRLMTEGQIIQEKRRLKIGGEVTAYWHKSLRYYSRPVKSLIGLIDEYSNPNISGAIGIQGEALVLDGFAKNRFLLHGRNVNHHEELSWDESDHNLDFIFEKDGLKYGIEVKNTLGYMDYSEFKTKIKLCQALQLKPVFAARMLPKIWINELNEVGGFALILKYQLYPWGFRELAKRVSSELKLPVDTPKALNDGTMQRFTNWHKRVNS